MADTEPGKTVCGKRGSRQDLEFPTDLAIDTWWRDRYTPVPTASAYTCTTCAIDGQNPITNLVDDRLANAVNAYRCETGRDHTFTPYFPGIQPLNENEPPLPPTILQLLAGDRAVADLYVKYAFRASLEGAHSDVTGWSVLNYYNESSVNEAQNPAMLRPFAVGPGVRVFSREGHSKVRNVEHAGVHEGDEVEARLLGIWASTPRDEDFIKKRPVFASPSQEHAQLDDRNFYVFLTKSVSTPGWRDFMYRSAYETAIALKCGTPVLAHSGGGAVVSFILRLLGVSPRVRDILRASNKPHRIIGLEAVLSKEAYARAQESFGHLDMQQLVVGSDGSSTYADVIVPNTLDIGSTPLPHTSVDVAFDPPGWDSHGGGHGGLGFYALAYGRIPTVGSLAH